MKIISTRPCLRLRTNLEPRIAFWGPDLGHILVLVLGSIFGRGFGALDLFVIVGSWILSCFGLSLVKSCKLGVLES